MADPTAFVPVIEWPDLDQLTLELTDLGIVLTKLKRYSYRESFLTPCDGWEVTLAADALASDVVDRITPGTPARIRINNNIQTTGFVDHVDVHTSREGGTEVTIEGRDILGPVVDSHVDPTLTFSESMTLQDLVSTVLNSYGIKVFDESNDANLNVITGQKRGVRTSKKGRPLKSAKIHQIKPYDNEQAFAFVSRITERFGLHLWPRADGSGVVLGQPTFDGEPWPGYAVRDKLDDPSLNNVIHGNIRRDGSEQPSVVLARGVGGGGSFAKASLRSAIVNPLQVVDIGPIKKRWPQVKFQVYDDLVSKRGYKKQFFAHAQKYISISARPLYLEDRESTTQEQLDNFVLREMSLRLRKALVARYTVTGHTLNSIPIAVDSLVEVDDDRCNYHGPLWILSRSFHKPGHGQITYTDIEAILPGTLLF